MEQSLNIELNIRNFIIQRMNNPKFKNLEEVAHSLGIARRTLSKYQQKFKIKKDQETNMWITKQKKQKAIVIVAYPELSLRKEIKNI